MRKHQVPVALRAVKTLKTLQVHPKDRRQKEEITDSYGRLCIPCASYENNVTYERQEQSLVQNGKNIRRRWRP